MLMTRVQFTCEHCGAEVPLPAGRRPAFNSCPECNWSKHTVFGTKEKPPCGAMMKPFLPGDGSVVHRCAGCGFMMSSPSEANTFFSPTNNRRGFRSTGVEARYYEAGSDGENLFVLDRETRCPPR